MTDLIDRQDAIDALNNILANYVPYLHGLTECIPLDCAVAIKALPFAQPEPHWIPCSVRLPSKSDHKDDMVLVCYGNGSIRFNTYMNGWTIGNPIAWMPLPEPYGGEDDAT